MLREIRIDDRTWDEAEPNRRLEWRVSIDQMLADEAVAFPEEAGALAVTVSRSGALLELFDTNGASLGTAEIPRASLTEHITEYVDVVRQMDKVGEGAGSSRLEALDMAKKLAHDDAARTLKRLLKPIEVNHAGCRRLWTLLLTLLVDTTRLVGIRGHRPVR